MAQAQFKLKKQTKILWRAQMPRSNREVMVLQIRDHFAVGFYDPKVLDLNYEYGIRTPFLFATLEGAAAFARRHYDQAFDRLGYRA